MKYSKIKIGDIFGDLTIMSLPDSKNSYKVLCQCSCGNIIEAIAYHILSGSTRSCRCQITKIKNKGLGEGTIKHLYRQYLINAKKSNRQFSISYDYFKYIISLNCSYCDKSPPLTNRYLDSKGKQMRKNKKYKQTTIELAYTKANGIDRVDNSKGYTVENSVTCCSDCNFLKGSLNREDFLRQIASIHNHINKIES